MTPKIIRTCIAPLALVAAIGFAGSAQAAVITTPPTGTTQELAILDSLKTTATRADAVASSIDSANAEVVAAKGVVNDTSLDEALGAINSTAWNLNITLWGGDYNSGIRGDAQRLRDAFFSDKRFTFTLQSALWQLYSSCVQFEDCGKLF